VEGGPLSIVLHWPRWMAVAWSPDGRKVAIAVENRVGFYEPNSGQPQRAWVGTGARPWELAFTADGRRLITVGEAARVWDVETAHLIKEVHPPTYTDICLALTPDGRTLITGGVGTKRLSFVDVSRWCAPDADPV
jgi:WD40 repeat protein